MSTNFPQYKHRLYGLLIEGLLRKRWMGSASGRRLGGEMPFTVYHQQRSTGVRTRRI